jgi:chemotaxis family two-component system response regulator Rcp1
MSSTHKIILVDDNPADANLTCEVLATSERPAQVSTVFDGEQALQFLHRSGQFAEASRPDLIILDLNLPRKDGRAVLAEVKADPELNDLPIVIFTTSHAPRHCPLLRAGRKLVCQQARKSGAVLLGGALH